MKKFRLSLRELRRHSVGRSVPTPSFHVTTDELAHWLPSQPSEIPVADLRAAHARRVLEHTNSLISSN